MFKQLAWIGIFSLFSLNSLLLAGAESPQPESQVEAKSSNKIDVYKHQILLQLSDANGFPWLAPPFGCN